MHTNDLTLGKPHVVLSEDQAATAIDRCNVLRVASKLAPILGKSWYSTPVPTRCFTFQSWWDPYQASNGAMQLGV